MNELEASQLGGFTSSNSYAIGRTSGWIAQWLEMIDDKEQKISRPRQIYTGATVRDYVPLEKRG